MAKRTSRAEPKKIGFSAIAGCFLISLIYFSFFSDHMNQLNISKFAIHPSINQSITAGSSISNLTVVNPTTTSTKKLKTVCDVSDKRSDVCEIEAAKVWINGNSSSVIYNVAGGDGVNGSWKIRPYARKEDGYVMGGVREVSVEPAVLFNGTSRGSHRLQCHVSHTIPAIVFSIKGYTKNFFHVFTDVIVPLFLTSRRFNGQVQFVITDMTSWWVTKYKLILTSLSDYPLIDFNRDNRTHCFRQAIVGLHSHKELSIVPSRYPFGHSMVDFTWFMRKTFSLNRNFAIRLETEQILDKRPRLLIISRNKTRRLLNLDEIGSLAEELGYKVVVAEVESSSDLGKIAETANSCDVMMGVHGAGLTNLVFLPINAVFIQIVPLGGLEWWCTNDFGKPAVDMNLKYLEYKINEEESSLLEQYPRDHVVFRDPSAIYKKGWVALRKVFLDNQDVRVDVRRFRGVLLKALELLHY